MTKNNSMKDEEVLPVRCIRGRIRKLPSTNDAVDVGDDEDDDGPKSKRRRIMENKSKFPMEIRTKIDSIVERTFVTEDDTFNAKLFLQAVLNTFHLLLINGLDSRRHSLAEIEYAIRLFPQVLAMKAWCEESSDYYYPVSLQLCTKHHNDDSHYFYNGDGFKCNEHGAIFVPLLVRLAIEFGSSFADDDSDDDDCLRLRLRGGLLLQDSVTNTSVLKTLMISSQCDSMNKYDTDHYNYVGIKFYEAMVQLREDGNFRKEDICEQNLLARLVKSNSTCPFPFKRFHFLARWDPGSLVHGWNSKGRYILLHHVANFKARKAIGIRMFSIVYSAGLRYLPFDLGTNLLFYQDCKGETPYHDACKSYGPEETINVIENSLGDYFIDNSNNDDCGSNNSVIIIDALIEAACNDNYHLDAVYFLLRRTPDVVCTKLLSKARNDNANINTITDINSDNDNKKKNNHLDRDGDNDEDIASAIIRF